MSTPKIIKKDLRSTALPEFNFFLLLRFAMVFAWSMQFIVMNGKCTASPKIPFLRYYRTKVIPAVSMALFAGHIVDQKESLLVKCILAFQ
jgi:hypothetical protein